MFIMTKRVRRANRIYEHLTSVESVRVDGTNTHRLTPVDVVFPDT